MAKLGQNQRMQEAGVVEGGIAFLRVVEECVGVAAAIELGAEPGGPVGEDGLGVAVAIGAHVAVQADISEVRGDVPGRTGAGEVEGAEGDVAAGENGGGGVGPPGGVAELDGVAVVGWEEGEEAFEEIVVGRKAGWELEEDGALVGPSRARRSRKAARGTSQPVRRRSWVISRGALRAKRKPCGTEAAQRSSMAAVGRR